MTKKKEELAVGAAENKKAEGEKKYARLPDKALEYKHCALHARKDRAVPGRILIGPPDLPGA